MQITCQAFLKCTFIFKCKEVQTFQAWIFLHLTKIILVHIIFDLFKLLIFFIIAPSPLNYRSSKFAFLMIAIFKNYRSFNYYRTIAILIAFLKAIAKSKVRKKSDTITMVVGSTITIERAIKKRKQRNSTKIEAKKIESNNLIEAIEKNQMNKNFGCSNKIFVDCKSKYF